MKADARTEAEVLAVLEGFGKAVETRNLDELLALFSPDPDLLVYGSAAGEKCGSLDELRFLMERFFACYEAVSLDLDWVSVSALGPVAWLAAEQTVHFQSGGKRESISGARRTLVLERRGDKWLIMQYHWSFPEALTE